MKSSRIVQLAIFAMVVFCDAEMAFANPIYSFTTIDVPGASEAIESAAAKVPDTFICPASAASSACVVFGKRESIYPR